MGFEIINNFTRSFNVKYYMFSFSEYMCRNIRALTARLSFQEALSQAFMFPFVIAEKV